MKILQINTAHYRRGGAETVYFNTISLLREKGHEVLRFSSKDALNEEAGESERYFVQNINIRELSFFRKIQKVPSYLYNFSAAKNLEKLILNFKPDIAHVHLFYNVLSVSILRTLKKYNIPVVHTVHDYRLLCPVYTFFDNKGSICELCRDRHFYHCLIKRCSEGKFSQSAMVTLEAYFWKYIIDPLDYIDHYIFVSSFIKNKHIEFNKKFENKCSHIYNFINLEPIPKTVKKGNYFLYFGRLTREKGIGTVLKVFLKKDDLKLVIAGTGILSNEIEKLSKDNKNIVYEGFKTGKALEKLILDSSFIIVPSEWYENNPMTVIEAFSLGKPVIGANIGGIPELVQHNINGFVFNSGDILSLETIINQASRISDSDYANLSASAFLFAKENFNKESHYKRLSEIYSSLVITEN